MPIRLLQTSFGFVFEKFVNRRKHDARAFCANAHIEVNLVIEKVNVAVTHNAEKLSRHVEIVGMNDSIPDGKFRVRIASNAVANTRDDVIEDF